jgi:hypothetical protein
VRRDDDPTASSEPTEPKGPGRARAAPKRDHAGSDDAGTAALLGVADVASMAFLVVEEAARSAREDLAAIMASVRGIDEQKRAWREAVDALNTAGARAAEHLSTVDRLTVEASRAVGGALDGYGESFSETALEQLDSWAVHSRLESERLQQQLQDAGFVAERLETLTERSELESLRLQQVMDRRSKLVATLSGILTKEAEAARAITENLK